MFKIINSFDLPVCRIALIINQVKCYHLREPILSPIYGINKIQKSSNKAVARFIKSWKKEEKNEILRKEMKIGIMSKGIEPSYRGEIYLNERKKLLFKNVEEQKPNEKYLKSERRMYLIRFPFDFKPNSSVDQKDGKRRYLMYTKRICSSLKCYGANATSLPLEIYPLIYLAYWQLMKEKNNAKFNCLCYFDYHRAYYQTTTLPPALEDGGIPFSDEEEEAAEEKKKESQPFTSKQRNKTKFFFKKLRKQFKTEKRMAFSNKLAIKKAMNILRSTVRHSKRSSENSELK